MNFQAPSFINQVGQPQAQWDQTNNPIPDVWDKTNYMPNPAVQSLQSMMAQPKVLQLIPVVASANTWAEPPVPYMQAPVSAWNNQVTGIEHIHELTPAPLLNPMQIDSPPIIYRSAGTAFTAASTYQLDAAQMPQVQSIYETLPILTAPSINAGV